ncbi:MAG: hypothetical protein NC212_08540 [Staphylococcus sp.]|nr:hypothetical protein [Staphylococcus sp.]
MTCHNILGTTRRHDISFLANGRIDLTSRIVRSLDIHPGDVIEVMTAEGEFYLYVSKRAESIIGRHEAQCNPTSKRGHHFRAWSHRLTAAILSECGVTPRADLTTGLPVEINGHKTLPIITKNIRK